MKPIADRLFGDIPPLRYVEQRAAGKLPDNIKVHEFYYPPGSLLGSSTAQRHHKSVNFTDAFRLMKEAGFDLIGQLVSPSPDGRDLSCNTDLSLDLVPRLRELSTDDRPILVAQVNRRLPPMGGSAVVNEHIFDAVVDDEALDYDLFGLPNLPVSDAEYAIGLRVASLLRDGDTIQIVIGGLGNSVAWSSILRHEDPHRFAELLDALGIPPEVDELLEHWEGRAPFEEGLYASTEMFVEGLLHMAKRGVLSRRMDDGLEDERVVSGVGGQYEFVTMAHALPDGRSVIMVLATRTSGGEVYSNIVWSYGHCTIPRHLRDIVVTEYGIADLRGKSDEEIV